MIRGGVVLMVEITKDAIDSVPSIDIPYISDKDNLMLQHMCKQVLYTSHKENNDKEVAVILDIFDFNRVKWFKGDENHVSIKLDWSAVISNEDYYNRYVVIHNHPDCSGFSMADIKSFLANAFLFCLIAVQANGSVHVLYKTKKTNILTRNWFSTNFSNVSDFYKVCEYSGIYYKYYRRKQYD